MEQATATQNKRFIGIDLGTTNTTCGVAELSAIDGSISYSQLSIPQPQIDPSSGAVSWNHSTILPSAVWLAEDNNVFTGALCVEYADIISEHAGSKVVHGIKSELGNRHWVLKHNGQDYRPAEISSILLGTVWEAICSKNFPEINGIIITIPSSFSSTMRRETLRAARMAGLPMEKVSLLDEPIAALFSEYGDTKDPFTKIQTEKPILVFDMGGGTVDVTVLKIRRADCVVDVLSTSRYNQVAGDDLDLEIAAYLWRRLSRNMSPVPSLTRSSALALLHAGEAVKLEVNKRIESYNINTKKLSTECRKKDATLVASFDLFSSAERLELSIPIADVLDLVLPFISEDESDGNYNRNIFTPIEQARDSAGLHFSDISQVYLVGGGAKFRPVYHELKRSFPENLSEALDATYAVSEGAARFAAAAYSGWRVSETTSERIYLRRNRAPFLEILPDKLPIPSPRTEPPRPLIDNDTIEMQEESRYLHLEFFQGSQTNDPQMSPVYTATLSFPWPLKQGTEMRSLVGYIDQDKIYHFEIGLTEPGDGRKITKMVEFSADSEAQPALKSGPQYQLNDNDSLATVLQDEPMRTQLNTRVGISPVSFLPPTASAPAQLTNEPMESLFEERNAILRAMNESWADAYIGDKFLPTRLRATLAALENLTVIPGETADQAPHLDLVKLYELYDVTLIRSLLDHSFLLYGITELEQKLGPVVDILSADLTENPERVKILLADLNQHADSSFDVSRELVEIFLKATANIQGIYESILNNTEFVVPFKVTAARLLGNEQDLPARLLDILKQLGNGLGRDEFDAKARPIIATLAATGPNGFEAALGAFNRKELGNAGPLVLGSFGKEFSEWALQHEQLPARYVPALFQALPRIRSRMLLDDLVFRLLDEWCNESEVARKVNEKRQRLRNPKIYNRFRSKTLSLVDDLDRGVPARDVNLIQKVEQAAIKHDHSYMLSLHRDEQLGNAIAEVLMNSVDDSAAAFLIDFSTRGNWDFQRHLLRQLLRRKSFRNLNESRQRLILEWPITKQMASIEMLQEILVECKPELHPFVDRMIFEKNQAARQ